MRVEVDNVTDPAQRLAFIEALRAAREKLEIDEADCVCWALIYGSGLRNWGNAKADPVVGPLIDWIESGLERSKPGPRYAFVTDWLYFEHGIALSAEECVQYRIEWINHMIRYFGGKP